MVNVNGTLNVLVAARDNDIKKLVNSSSCAIYGDPLTLPIREDTPFNPLSPYAVSKLVGEYYCQAFTQVYGLSTISLRYFNVYGPRQNPKGEYAAVIPRFITRVLQGDSPIIFGDGKQTRDFSFVDDVINANILAIESKACGVFNIAGGKRISINELAQMVIKIVARDVEVVREDPRPGDILDSLADVSKAKKELGFVPMFDLSKGLNETLCWLRRNI